MVLVSTPNKRLFLNNSSLFYLLFLIYFSLTLSLSSNSSPYSYDELLEQATIKMKAYDYGRALDRLEFARKKVDAPDYRYFYILGETYYRMGKYIESLDAFRKSLDLEPGQIELLDKLITYYEKDRRPLDALHYSEKFLQFIPQDKDKLFRAAVLANRVGKFSLGKIYLNQLESDTKFKLEKSAIIDQIYRKIHEKEWKEALDLSSKYILYYPREEVIHESKILCERALSLDSLESSMIDATAIFSENPNLAIRYGIFLQEKARMLESLAAFRRAFAISLENSDSGNREEIFFLIRQVYTYLNRAHDANAMNHISILSKAGDNLKESDLHKAYLSFPKNREILIFGIHFYQMNNMPKELQEWRSLLEKRDLENEESEFVKIIGPFSYH